MKPLDLSVSTALMMCGLALKGCKDDSVDMPFALDQIQGWQTARLKLPTWAATEGIIYPPHLNMEQCSSEETARYKRECLAQCCEPQEATLIDLTGGFGVDFSLMSRGFRHAVYGAKCKACGGG